MAEVVLFLSPLEQIPRDLCTTFHVLHLRYHPQFSASKSPVTAHLNRQFFQKNHSSRCKPTRAAPSGSNFLTVVRDFEDRYVHLRLCVHVFAVVLRDSVPNCLVEHFVPGLSFRRQLAAFST